MDLMLNVNRNSIPFLDCWVGAWAMHEPHFQVMHDQLKALNLNLHLANADHNRDAALARIEDSFAVTENGIGVINIQGSLMKQSSSFSSSASTIAIRRELSRMASDDSVRGILLKIDSPGGTVAGTKELADAVAKVNKSKPVWAYCNDLTASAAYWVASQCGHVGANPTAQVGSIGTYCVVADSSKAAEKAGFQIHVVRAGEFKGSCTPGTEITVEQLAELTAQVKGLNTFFLDAVSTGRGIEMSEVAKLADGRIHLASEAKSLGLIDDVSAFEDFYDRFSSSVSAPASPVSLGENSMSTENTAKPATLAEIDAKFPKASDSWKLSCARSGMTISQCQESYIQLLEGEAAAEKKRADLAELKLARPGAKALGAKGPKLKSSDTSEDDEEKAEDEELEDEEAEDEDEEEQAEDDAEEAKSKWNAKVDSYLSRCGGNRAKATVMAAKKHPLLRQRLLATSNAARDAKQRRRRR